MKIDEMDMVSITALYEHVQDCGRDCIIDRYEFDTIRFLRMMINRGWVIRNERDLSSEE